MVNVPGRSIWSIFSFNVASWGLAAFGALKKTKMIAAPKPPIGRLIQKHHLQVKLSVKTPPRRGPMTDATPNVAPITPVKAGLFAGGAEKAMMVYAPEAIPAPPRPATALPTMRVVELFATAQIKLPSSKKKMLIR